MHQDMIIDDVPDDDSHMSDDQWERGSEDTNMSEVEPPFPDELISGPDGEEVMDTTQQPQASSSQGKDFSSEQLFVSSLFSFTKHMFS